MLSLTGACEVLALTDGGGATTKLKNQPWSRFLSLCHFWPREILLLTCLINLTPRGDVIQVPQSKSKLCWPKMAKIGLSESGEWQWLTYFNYEEIPFRTNLAY